MPDRTRRRLGFAAAALVLTFAAGNQVAHFDVAARFGASDRPLARATVELAIAGISVVVSYTTGLSE